MLKIRNRFGFYYIDNEGWGLPREGTVYNEISDLPVFMNCKFVENGKYFDMDTHELMAEVVRHDVD